MLSTVLNSERAIEVNIAIMRAFVQLRQMLQSNEELNRKLIALEQKYDAQFKVVFDALRQLMIPSPQPRKGIGFRSEEKKLETLFADMEVKEKVIGEGQRQLKH